MSGSVVSPDKSHKMWLNGAILLTIGVCSLFGFLLPNGSTVVPVDHPVKATHVSEFK